MNTPKLFFYLTIATEIYLISSLISHIYHNRKSQEMSVVGIKRSEIEFPKSEYSHFYEPKPNSKIEQDLSFANHHAIQTINSDSLNEQSDYTHEKKDTVFRIIALGDSFTYGALENTADNYPERLENLLNESCKNKKFEVINLGMSGYDISYEVERFRIRGMAYNPDMVLWFLKEDDFDVNTELVLSTMQSYTAQELKNFEEKNKKNQLANVGYLYAIENANNLYGEARLVQNSQQSMEKINQFYKGRTLIFNFNTRMDKYNNLAYDFASKSPNASFYGNLVNIYSDSKNYWPDMHPTSKGYALIAKDLFDYLIRSHYFECNK